MAMRLTHVQNLAHGTGQRAPVGRIGVKLPATRAREFVELGFAVVVGCAPTRFDPAASFKAVEGGVERALLYLEQLA